jgi:hypothetical protein
LNRQLPSFDRYKLRDNVTDEEADDEILDSAK